LSYPNRLSKNIDGIIGPIGLIGHLLILIQFTTWYRNSKMSSSIQHAMNEQKKWLYYKGIGVHTSTSSSLKLFHISHLASRKFENWPRRSSRIAGYEPASQTNDGRSLNSKFSNEGKDTAAWSDSSTGTWKAPERHDKEQQ